MTKKDTYRRFEIHSRYAKDGIARRARSGGGWSGGGEETVGGETARGGAVGGG